MTFLKVCENRVSNIPDKEAVGKQKTVPTHATPRVGTRKATRHHHLPWTFITSRTALFVVDRKGWYDGPRPRSVKSFQPACARCLVDGYLQPVSCSVAKHDGALAFASVLGRTGYRRLIEAM